MGLSQLRMYSFCLDCDDVHGFDEMIQFWLYIILIVSDSGIGMTKEELVDCLGTIAQSGTSKFLKALKVPNDW